MSQEASVHLAALVRHFRLTAGLNQEELAERTGLSVRTISDFERDLRTSPRLETIRMLADGLGLSASDRASLIAAARPELTTNLVAHSNEEQRSWAHRRPGSQSTGTLIGREREVADLVSMLSQRHIPADHAHRSRGRRQNAARSRGRSRSGACLYRRGGFCRSGAGA